MVRTRVRAEEQDTTWLQLKTGASSPTKSVSSSPRKQRVLKGVANSVLLASAAASDGIAPSRFSRAGTRVTQSRPELAKDASSTILRCKKLHVEDEETEDEKTEDVRMIGARLRRDGRRRVVDSDSESESDIADLFAVKLALHDRRQSGGSLPTKERSGALADTEDLVDALENQGFDFLHDHPQAIVIEPNINSSRPTTASGLDVGALLSFEPAKSRSPVRLPPERPSTPTKQSPTKITLKSPTKRLRLPESPHKPSADEFWCPSTVNEWIDQHSPQKPIKSPSKVRSLASKTGAIPFPLLPSSPAKVRQAKKQFNDSKHAIATAFLAELDRDITSGQIAALTAATGGVQLVWSNKLNSTAGRAHWRKQQVRTQHSDGTTLTETRHTASIELAEKVLDEEARLVNTLAHEFCHLATFMIDGVKTNPHGKEFKAWARLCSERFAARGVLVTTKHSYDIDYKYVWECSSCGTEYKRHSKSVDPARHRCGACRAMLVQVRPVPRKGAASEYQLFVKEHFQRVKRLDRSASHAAVMETLGKLYRQAKSSDASKQPEDDDLIQGIQTVELSD